MNNTLVGIQIKVGDKIRFIGKIGSVPPNKHFGKAFWGVRALYKEEVWSKAYSYRFKALSIDTYGWEVAKQNGAKGMIIFMKDRYELWCVSAEKIDNCFSYDLSEKSQNRIPLDKFMKENDIANPDNF